MPAVTDVMHSELGAVHRKRRQLEAEIRTLAKRTDPGAVQRSNNLRAALDKLDEREAKLMASIEHQERVQRANGLREEHMTMQRALAAQGINVGNPVVARSDEPPPPVTLQFEGGADEKDSAIARATGAPRINLRGSNPWVTDRPFQPSELRARAYSAVDATDLPGRGIIAEMLGRDREDSPAGMLAARWTLSSSNPQYQSAFVKVMIDPATGAHEFTNEERVAFQQAQSVKRSLQIGDGTASAGLMAPYALDPTWNLTSAGEIDPVRQLARVRSIAGYEWRGVATEGVMAHWRAESAEVDDDTPTLAQPVIRPERADVFVPFSIEASQDASELMENLRLAIADAKAVLEADGWINGTGVASNEPEGIVTAILASDGQALDVTVDPATGETYAVADVYSTLQALPPRFRADASWLMGLETFHTTRRYVPAGDTTEARLFDDAEGRLLRKPWFETTALRTTADIVTTETADNVILIVGDIARAYTVIDRVGLTVELVGHLFGANRRPTGERGVFAMWRTSAGIVNLNAVRGLNITTTA